MNRDVAYFNVLSWHFPVGIKSLLLVEWPIGIFLRIDSFQAEIQTVTSQNKKISTIHYTLMFSSSMT